MLLNQGAMDDRRIGLGVAAIVSNAAGAVALLKRIAGAGQGLWGLPGGRVQAGETLTAAILREVSEELGVEGAVSESLGLFEDIGQHDHWISAIFVVEAPTETARNREPEFHEALVWALPSALPGELTPVTREALRRWDQAGYG